LVKQAQPSHVHIARRFLTPVCLLRREGSGKGGGDQGQWHVERGPAHRGHLNAQHGEWLHGPAT
jgi:hypothetical protein